MFINSKRLLSVCICLSLSSGLSVSVGVIADPMRPPGFGQASTKRAYVSTDYTLSQILISDQRKRAVINEQLVSVGDSVQGARVINIETDQVTLRVDGRTKVLAINTAKGFNIKRETE